MPVSAPTPKQEATKTTTTPSRLRELAEISPELAKLVAKNPSTASDFLKELGSHSDAAIRKNVVGNPNTPAEVLLKLAGQFPGQLLDNPVFDLLLLENPNFLADLSESSLRSLLKRDKVPGSFLEWAASHRDEGVLMAVVMNPSTPKRALEIIVENCRRKGASKLVHPSNHGVYFDCLRQWHSAELAEAAMLHVNWAGEISEDWHEVAKVAMQTTMLDHNRDTAMKLWKIGAMPDVLLPALHRDPQLKIAENIETDASALGELAKDWKHMLKSRQAVAKHPSTPVAILEQLMGDHNGYEVRTAAIQHPKAPFLLQQQFQMQLGIVEHPNTCTEQLQELATSRWAHIRLGVAGHPHTSAAVLEQLAQDPDALVRTAVVLNANTTSSALEHLANDPDYWLRKGVGCHPNVTIPLLEKLALDDTPNGPREAVALNPKTPLSLLQTLKQNSKLYNHIEFERNLKSRTEQLPELFLNAIPWSLNCLVSEIPTCYGIPEGMRRGFFYLKEPPSPANPDLLSEMAQSPNQRTLWLVALNPATPVTGLLHIANTADQWISKRAVQTLTQKSETSAEVLQQLMCKADWTICVAIACHPNISDEGLEQLAQRQEWQVRMTVAKNPKSPSNLLEKLAQDKEWTVRQAVAQNISTPITTLQKLAEDSLESVRKLAIKTLSQIPKAFPELTEAYTVVTNPMASSEQLEVLAFSPWLQIRIEVARHQHTDTTLLTQLALDTNLDIQIAVALNPQTSAEVLKTFLDSPNAELKQAAIANVNMPTIQLQELADGKHRKLSPLAIKTLLQQGKKEASRYLEPYAKGSQPSLNRLAVFLHPLAPVELLAKNVRSLNWLERYAIAQNPNTPPTTLKILMNDGNRVVRATANATLLQHSSTSPKT